MRFFSILNRIGKDLNDAEHRVFPVFREIPRFPVFHPEPKPVERPIREIPRFPVFHPEPKPVERPIREIPRFPGKDISIFYQKKIRE